MYLLTDRRVKRLCKEFEFHGTRIYSEEGSKTHTVIVDYPEGNKFWYVDFKRYVLTEILDKDNRYQKEWEWLLNKLKGLVKDESESLQTSLASITPAMISTKMKEYDLREEQSRDMLNLMVKMKRNKIPAGLILSEQRTGKTRVAVATCVEHLEKGANIIVVCPKSAIASWTDEFLTMNKYCKQEIFKVKTIKRLKDITDSMPYFSDCLNVKIITYGLFKILSVPQIRNLLDIVHTKNIMYISDESHILRNLKTLQSDAIFKFKDTCLRNKVNLSVIGITGTPAVKESYDVFGVFCLINFSKIQFRPYEVSFNMFKEHFYNCEDTSYGKKCKSLRRENELTYLLETVSVQTKQENLDLFKGYTKTYLKYTLEMDSLQKEIYESVRDTMEFEDEIDCMNLLVQLTRLQQICTDPSGIVSSYDQLSPKIKWVLGFLDKNPIQCLIVAKKRKPLDKLEELLEEKGITYVTYNGTVSSTKRNANVTAFRNGEAKVFLLQLDASKESLTLPEAKCTIFLDRDFTPGFNSQIEARMTPVSGVTCTKYVIDLVMSGTVEEGLYSTLVHRKESVDTINTIKKIMKGD